MPESPVPPADTLPADLADLVSRCRSLPLARLVEALREDQARRWRAGQRLLVEAYLGAFPQLAASAEDALVLIWGEALLRRERGEDPQPSEYRGRFPQHADALEAQFALQGHLDGPPDAPTLAPQPPAGPLRPQVPGYEVLGELGRGGMGVVYRARQVVLNRLVALKMILAGSHAGAEAVDRFRAEAEAVARLQHPNIVQIFEVGEQAGLPYFALEFVDGGSLAEKLDGTPLPPRPAARLVETLARAMHAAHAAGIAHRDLKPANVLLTADGTPKITDFGLAKKLDGGAGQTASGAIVGTPSYMAPEQAAGQGKTVGPAADVYALGAILYELLTGRPPFKAATPLDTVLQVVSDEPVPPRRLQPKVPRDLETICLKCLEKEPRRRYPTALDLADDLRRFQDGKPITSRPVRTWERLGKWAKRRPAAAALLGVTGVAVLALVGAVVGLLYNTRLEAALEDAQRARQAEAEQRNKAEMFQYFHHIARANAGWRDADLVRVKPLLEECPKGQRRWEWDYLQRLCHAELLTFGHDIFRMAFSPDGTRIATAGLDHTVRVWDATTGRQLFILRGHSDKVRFVAFSPDGTRLASASFDRTVKVWDATAGQEALLTLKGHTAGVNGVAFSPDGTRVASGAADNTVKVWDWKASREILSLKGHNGWVDGVAFSPDSKRLASASRDHTVKVWDLATGRERFALKGHTGWVLGVAYSPDGTRIASASADQTVRLWDAATGRQLLTLPGHTSDVWSVAFSSDGSRLASSSVDQTVRVWDAATGQLRLTLKGHSGEVTHVAFSPDGTRLASAGAEGKVRVWDPTWAQEASILRGHAGKVWSAAFSPDGERLASAGEDGLVKVWDATTRREVFASKGHAGEVWQVAFRPDGKRLASAGQDGTVRLWDARTGRPAGTFQGHTSPLWGLAFSPDGKRLACASQDGTVRLWDAGGRQQVLRRDGPTIWGSPVAFSPDGTRLATDGPNYTVKVWDVATRREVLSLKGHEHQVWAAAFSPDGGKLASGSSDNTAKLWDLLTGQEIFTLTGHASDVDGVAFSPDGARLASASRDGTIKLWDVATGQEALTLRGHTNWVLSVAFSPDGTRLASASWDGTVRLWDARPLTRGVRVEREAVGLLDHLFAKPLCRADVLKYLRTSPTIAPGVRDKALALAGSYREELDAERYHRASWAVVRQRYLNAFQYRFALRQAETACRLAPRQRKYRTTLGVAQYRAGRYQEALETLTEADRLNQGVPADLAFLAMVQHRLGRNEQARMSLTRLRKVLKKPDGAKQAEAQAFGREAEALVEGKPAEPKK
jgi:WD40 repeat protein